MNLKIILSGVLVATCLCPAVAVYADTFAVQRGGVPQVVSKLAGTPVPEVVITGTVSHSDIMALRSLPSAVKRLDLSGVRIDTRDLPPYALMGIAVQEVVLPRCVTQIGEGAFAESEVRKLVFPDSLINLSPYAMRNCRNLLSADLSATGVTSVSRGCFSGCTLLGEVNLPIAISEIGDDAFRGAGLRRIDIRGVNRIGEYAFANCRDLADVSMAGSPAIGEGAFFNNTSLAAVGEVIAAAPALGYMGSSALNAKTEINAEVVKEGSFAGVEVGKVVFGRDVRQIQQNAFRNVRNLGSVDVSALGSTVPQLDRDAFAGIELSGVKLIMSPGSERLWQDAPVWREFDTRNISVIVNPVDSSDAISISRSGNELYVQTATPLHHLAVYNLDGSLIAELRPTAENNQSTSASQSGIGNQSGSGDTTANLNDYRFVIPAGIVIVDVTTATHRRILKLAP